MQFSTVYEWLNWIGSVHHKNIELGLPRVRKVAQQLNVLKFDCPVITVGGTNGKGSTVAGLLAIYRAAGLKTGAFTSPYLFSHNEQVEINGEYASDEDFCQAYQKIENARGDIKLTAFEFHTLAALIIFHQHDLDVVILEVGLGGRLDAVNIVDSDVAVTTSISLDHVDCLGTTREAIGFEKAGIYRANCPVVCGDSDPPLSLIKQAENLQARFYCQQQDFGYHEKEHAWSWYFSDIELKDLPKNGLLLQNMATVLMIIHLLQHRLPVTLNEIKQGLLNIKLIGRIQKMDTPIQHVIDVSHNEASIKLLALELDRCLPPAFARSKCGWDDKVSHQHEKRGKTYAVFSMLRDKDIETCIKIIASEIDEWFVGPLETERACTQQQLASIFANLLVENVHVFDSIQAAYKNARERATTKDRIIIFGSFHTVSSCYPLISTLAFPNGTKDSI